MQKNTIIVIILFIVITAASLFIAFQAPNTATRTETEDAAEQTPRQPVAESAQTTLTLLPNPVVLNADGTGTVDVQIDTKSNRVTAMQLELQYDPKAITNVRVTASDFIAQPIILINKVDARGGTVTFALGINPTQQPVTGKGIIARVTFTKVRTTEVTTSTLSILDTSLVTSSGISGSVLKAIQGTSINLAQ